MLSRFWLRLGRLCLLILVLYLFLSYTILFTIIIRQEIAILDGTKVISVFSSNQGASTLQGQVRNVFGDPIPHAVIIIADRLVQADNTGTFSVHELNPGRHTLEIFAGDYEKYNREIQLEIGMNNPPIKYETGLWPSLFLVDFHIFYKETNQVFGLVGFANGSTEPIYIQRATLSDVKGNVITDILHDRNGFQYYAELSNKLEITEEPQRALKWAPRMWQSGEFSPLEGVFHPGPYSLEVHYGLAEEHKLGQYRVLVITDHLDLDNDWNPHLP